MLVVSIDIGVRNFAMCIAHGDPEGNLCIRGFHKYDLLNQRSGACRGMAEIDGLLRILEKHRNDFAGADVILVERQPPGGILSVQAVLYARYVQKVKLVSPNAMHKYFKMTGLDYEQRKSEVDRIVSQDLWPKVSEDAQKAYVKSMRRHDMADAACFAVQFISSWHARRSKKNPFFQFTFDPNTRTSTETHSLRTLQTSSWARPPNASVVGSTRSATTCTSDTGTSP
jgi:hypothetical protein